MLLAGLAGAAGALGLGLPALAQSLPADRKLLLVFNPGGWDPTRVFAPEFSNPNVAMEATASVRTIGDLRFVDHPARPSVGTFFARHAARSLILNGLVVPSVTHEVCTTLMLTGATDTAAPDWGASIAWPARDRYTLPHLVLGGPAYAGPYGAAVARTGATGQLEALLSGAILDRSAVEIGQLRAPSEAVIDRFLARRAAAKAASAGPASSAELLEAYEASLGKAIEMKDLRHTVDFTGGLSLTAQSGVAVDTLSRGISRVVSMVYGPESWDSHTDNDPTQSRLFEGLFGELSQLMALLDQTPGETTDRLSDEVVVVVFSEMGRTPRTNALLGKDHWPSTSVMMWGPGLTTGRVVGGFDAGYFGRTLIPESGELSDAGVLLGPKTLGATLLTLAGVDPAAQLPGVPVLSGILS